MKLEFRCTECFSDKIYEVDWPPNEAGGLFYLFIGENPLSSHHDAIKRLRGTSKGHGEFYALHEGKKVVVRATTLKAFIDRPVE